MVSSPASHAPSAKGALGLLIALMALACAKESVRGQPEPRPGPTPQGPPVPATTDRIGDRDVARADSWWVDGPRIRHGDAIVRLRGINWFGLETPDRAPHGLWSGRSTQAILEQVMRLGFNALRVPVSPDAIRHGTPSAPWAVIDDGDGDVIDTGREHLNALLALTERLGLHVLLDLHTCQAGRPAAEVGRPDACPGYAIADWHRDLAELARLADAHRNIVGIDLFNEPHALTWPEWKLLAEGAARVVLEANPRVLVFVQGVGGRRSGDPAIDTFWGEDLSGALAEPLAIPASRLVFSPHVYGPGVRRQPYFDAADYPKNLPAIWDRHFGFLHRAGRAVIVGEWGGWNDDRIAPGEEAWNQAFVAYLAGWHDASFFYWSLNPNSGDTGGLLDESWTEAEPRRMKVLDPLLRRRE